MGLSTVRKEASTHASMPRHSAPWTAWESQAIFAACAYDESKRPNYEEIARLLENRTAEEVRYRWYILRDLARRRLRRKVMRLAREEAGAPYQGQLHSSLVWVETQWWDLEPIKL